MTDKTIPAVLIAFILSAILCPLGIPFLRRLKFGQQVRDDGPEAHLQKQGTPTMGGIMILLSITLTSLLFVRNYPRILPILLMTISFGLIGLADDLLKIHKKQSEGLSANEKLAAQFVVTAIFVCYLIFSDEADTGILIPFTGGFQSGYFLHIGILFIPFAFFVVLGSDNGVNFTDGLDGLCASVTIVVAAFFSVVSVRENMGISPVTGAVMGSLLGFLLYNVYPAQVFMGDTGSLALGGFVAASALMMQMPLFILIAGIIYVVEVLSVILQVGYFKITHGKRIFRMAPLHHHFELGGWPETKVVTIFTIVTVIACLIAGLAL